MPPPATKWDPLIQAFFLYTRRYLRSSFYAIRLLGELPQFADNGRTPLIVCLNHTSWWDVLVPFFIERELFQWDYYGIMDARQLNRYRIFAHMGMIGVDRTSLSGAREFLEVCETLLKGRRRALWFTPQGEMVSSYQRPIRFQPGLGRLASRLGAFHYVSIALHYDFWNERLPEAFISISAPELIEVSDTKLNSKAFVSRAETAMQSQLDSLLAAVEQRDPAPFRCLLQGGSISSPIYDSFRALRARILGETFRSEHGHLVTPSWKRRENETTEPGERR